MTDHTSLVTRLSPRECRRRLIGARELVGEVTTDGFRLQCYFGFGEQPLNTFFPLTVADGRFEPIDGGTRVVMRIGVLRRSLVFLVAPVLLLAVLGVWAGPWWWPLTACPVFAGMEVVIMVLFNNRQRDSMLTSIRQALEARDG